MKLYKYRCDKKRDIKMLVENKLFAPNKDKLNDPTEMCFDDSEFLCFPEKQKEHSLTVKEQFDDIKDFTKTKCGIFSLSKDVKNELLWAYYAIGHKGFCIEYDSDIIMESYNYEFETKNSTLKSKPLVQLIEVDYQDSYPVFIGDLLLMDDQTPALRCLVGTKSKSWKPEDEVRLIFNKHGHTEIDYRAITGIYFGVKFYDDNEKTNVMQKLRGRGIKYYQMKFVDKSYKMDFDEIEDKYFSAPKYVANNLPYDDISWTGMPSGNTKYKDLALQALEFVMKEPCINKIKSCYISPSLNPMIAIETFTNDDFKDFPIKIYRFDIDIATNEIIPRRFQRSMVN